MILHGFFVDGVLRGVADLRILAREAEAAFSIEKRWQSHGVGSALLERTLLAARNRGVKLLQVCCLMDNPFAKPPAVLGRLKAVERILE